MINSFQRRWYERCEDSKASNPFIKEKHSSDEKEDTGKSDAIQESIQTEVDLRQNEIDVLYEAGELNTEHLIN